MDKKDTLNGIPILCENDEIIGDEVKCQFCLKQKKCITLKDLDTGLLLNICVQCKNEIDNTIKQYL